MKITFTVEAAIIVLAYAIMIGIGFGFGIAVPFSMMYRAFIRDAMQFINEMRQQ